MATLLAPFTSSMKLGSGFNSFTQELCVDNAVINPEGSNVSGAEVKKPQAELEGGIPQSVTYSTSVVNKVTDVTKNLNINGAFAVKYDNLNVKGQGDFLNSDAIKESDISYMISVKVVNLIVSDKSLTKFSPITNLPKPGDFTSVYGDSFISGFQEGGEFTAVISIKAKDREQAESLKADGAVEFSKDKLAINVEGSGGKKDRSIFEENETTVSVSWTGGGQNLKKSEEDWTFDNMRAAALKFPELVAKVPIRTYAILTKYTSLKSFHSLGPHFVPLTYEHAGNYTNALQEAYVDYKNINRNIQLLAMDVASGIQSLDSRPGSLGKDFGKESLKAATPALMPGMEVATVGSSGKTESLHSDDGFVKTDKDSDYNSETAIERSSSTDPQVANPVKPLIIEKPYPPTIFGLEAARTHCRFMMNRIVSEVDLVSRHPEIASDEMRPQPYMSPLLFRLLLPVGTVASAANV